MPTFFLSYLAQLFLEREMFRTKVVQKIKTHFMFNNFFFYKIMTFMRSCGKIRCNRTGQR